MDRTVIVPEGYALGRPVSGEAAAVSALAATSDAAVGAHPVLTEDTIRQHWVRPRFRLDEDAWTIHRDAELVGYAEVADVHPRRRAAFAIVHPAHTGLGLGTVLAGLIEERARHRAEPEAMLYSAVTTQNEAGAELLRDRGYRWARRFRQMEVQLGGQLPAPEPPSGIEFRSLDPSRDLPAAHAIFEEAFADHWDFTPTSYEEFLAREVSQEIFDPSLWIVAVDDGRPVGVLFGIEEATRGWVAELGVVRSHRGRGIASELLRRSFALFGQRGLPRVGLHVDSDSMTGAVGVYERVGMRAVTSYDLWGREVDPTSRRGEPR